MKKFIWLSLLLAAPQFGCRTLKPWESSTRGDFLPINCQPGPFTLQHHDKEHKVDAHAVCHIVSQQGLDEIDEGENDPLITLRQALKYASERQFKIAVLGGRFSESRATYGDDIILIDMSAYNTLQSDRIMRQKRRIRAQAGVTWADIQQLVYGPGISIEEQKARLANPSSHEAASLAAKVRGLGEQTTVGETLHLNEQGINVTFGPVAAAVNAFEIMLHDGTIVQAKRDAAEGSKERELFSLAIGGYGLFGVILEVELILQDNTVVEKATAEANYKVYASTFLEQLKKEPALRLHYSLLSVDQTKPANFLQSMTLVSFRESAATSGWVDNTKKSAGEKPNLMTLSEAMQGPAKEELKAANMQTKFEYAIPASNFAGFIETVKTTALNHKLNFGSAMVRYTPKNAESFFSYFANQEVFRLQLAVIGNQNEASLKAAVEELAKAAEKFGGSPNPATHPTTASNLSRKSFLNYQKLLEAKKAYDPTSLFANSFFSPSR